MTILSNSVVSVEVAEALPKRAPDLVGSTPLYGSVAFRYTSLHARNLYAAVMIHMHGQPIGYHVDAFPVSSEARGGSREGIWWQPHAGAKDVLVISNGSDKLVSGTLSLFDATGKRWSQPLALSGYRTLRMSVGDLVRAAGLAGSYGGIKYEVPANVSAVDSVHVLYDETTGFSATMKMFDRDPAAKLEERTWAGNKQWTMWAPMLALRSPDPAVGFPAGTVLEPTIFVYNPTGKTAPASTTLSWRSDSATGKVSLPAMRLKPFETKRIEIGPMQKQLGIPADAHWALVTLRSAASPDDLIAVAASYDSTGRYGAQTPFSDQLAEHWVGGQWQVDATHNTIAAVTNGGDRPTNALVTLHYNDGKDKYEIQRTLQPGEQMWLNFGDLIHNNVADRKGRTLPSTLTSGTYDLIDLSPGIGGNLFEGKVILDKTWGHLAYGCVQCCGFSDPFLLQDPVDVIINASQPLTSWGVGDCDGNDYSLDNFYGSGTWSSGNGSIANVTRFSVKGVSAGSTNGYASAPIVVTKGVRCPLLPQQAQTTAHATCAIPTNFRQTVGRDAGSGVLHFEYAWDSSTAHLSDLELSGCTVNENVSYPGGNPFYWPSPPWASGTNTPNPTILPVPPIPGADGTGADNHSTAGFRTPYQAASFTATQYYQYSCTCDHSSNVHLAGPISIVRSVGQNPDLTWKYTITKSGVSAYINPLP